MRELTQIIEITAPLVIATCVAVVGWIVAHRFAASRDRTNKQRELRVQYLIEAFRCLAGASGRPMLPEIAHSIESAVTDVQLFGTDTQIELVQKWARGMSAEESPCMDDLLVSLRNDLRSELNLSRVELDVFRIRVREHVEPVGP